MPSAVTAANLFDTAYDAARQNDFDNTLKVLEDIRGSDALLQALLQAQSDGSEGFTILHQAAWHGDARAVRELLRLGEQFHVIVPDDASPGTTCWRSSYRQRMPRRRRVSRLRSTAPRRVGT